jgi:hypothetical protein
MEKTAKAVETFANKFGTIGFASQDTMRYPVVAHKFKTTGSTWKTDEFSKVDRWFPEIEKMKRAVSMWQRGQFSAPSDPTLVVILSRGTVCHRADKDSTVRLIFIPDALEDALWLQFYEAVARDAKFKRCKSKACKRWFEVGLGSGKRSHAKFCSVKCRNDFHNKSMKEDRK